MYSRKMVWKFKIFDGEKENVCENDMFLKIVAMEIDGKLSKFRDG